MYPRYEKDLKKKRNRKRKSSIEKDFFKFIISLEKKNFTMRREKERERESRESRERVIEMR